MFAVIKTGGKQYKVAAGDKLTVEKIEGEDGLGFVFDQILMIGMGEEITVGAPFITGAGVAARIINQTRGPKVISFKKRRRQNSKRKRGHRQDLTIVEIVEISKSGVKAPAHFIAAPVSTGASDSSNLSIISGVGPTIEKKLRGAGIQNWETIAAWSEADVAKWDKELALRGRATREEWVIQAQELLAGKPPRAKADQAELASGKDY
jgi:large subunit ribosomal protein L21